MSIDFDAILAAMERAGAAGLIELGPRAAFLASREYLKRAWPSAMR